MRDFHRAKAAPGPRSALFHKGPRPGHTFLPTG